MAAPEKKSILKRAINLKVFFGYISESFNIIRQGYAFRDKFILTRYFSSIPVILIKSLFTGKSFREIEEERKNLSGNVTLKNTNGIFFCGNNILTVYIMDEQNEKDVYPYFRSDAGCFIDIGAHIGKYSIRLGKNPSTQIIALEPDVYNFNLLRKNIALNNLKNIICLNKGAFSSKTEIPFYTSGDGEGEHSIFSNDAKRHSTKIQVDSIDNIIESLGIERKIDLIKIDVEGAESDVMKGAQKTIAKNRPDLIIEILKTNNNNFQEIQELLKPYNYTFQQLDEDNYFFKAIRDY